MMIEIGCRAKREDITRTHTIAGENRLCITIHIVNYGMYSDVTNRCYICAELALRCVFFPSYVRASHLKRAKKGRKNENDR